MIVDVDAYLARIGYHRPLRLDVATLTALHRSHLAEIPYENLDIHLGRKLQLGADAAFDKLVTQRRGGWCYEMNELLITVLRAIGFNVHRAGAGVAREERGDLVLGNHLIGIADVQGERFLIDVGFGDGPLDPIPLAAGTYRQGAFELGLTRIGDWWRFLGHSRCAAKSFDFTEEPRAPDWFAAKCIELQTSPASGFVQKTVVQRRLADRIYVLRDAVFTELTEHDTHRRIIGSQAEHEQVLVEFFGLDLGEDAALLWPQIARRHEVFEREQQASAALAG